MLLHNWPKSKEEHDHLAIKIKKVFKEFQKERKNRREIENVDIIENALSDGEKEDNLANLINK
jgi:hypothetical protein